MQSKAIEKIQGGKLLIIKIEFNKKIDDIKILGDFFAHPENSIEKIEKLIVGTSLNYDSDKLVEKIERLIEKEKYQLIGIDAESIIRVLGVALR
ncbi:hypothetical protein HOD20_08625 [archaeon]|jgi:hypothetical protein|nr:hypothetical protein [archaeon]MBT4352574.1 hypothetical protein [archaeon]MBT4648643.1 hypothetical protein [archaeon]MBT6821821.1 hypothetical protein [archaeon]MBT7392231.1 hypothetical protein [archaeon]